MRPLTRRAVALACVAAFLLAASPIAIADHAYSHRYIVFGRLIDEAGRPITDTQVEVGLDATILVQGLCDEQPGTGTDAWERTTTRTRTNEYGEFTYCFHTHRMPRVTTSNVNIRTLEQDFKAPIDPKLRRTITTITVPGAEGRADAESFENSYLVSGRVWYPQSKKQVEGVEVLGNVVENTPVKITFTPTSGEAVVTETKTNNYGDFAVRLPDMKDAQGTITVESDGETKTSAIDPKYRMSDVAILTSAPAGMGATVLKYGGLVVLVGLVSAGAWFVFRNVSEKRDIAEARAKSTRKRAQR